MYYTVVMTILLTMWHVVFIILCPMYCAEVQVCGDQVFALVDDVYVGTGMACWAIVFGVAQVLHK